MGLGFRGLTFLCIPERKIDEERRAVTILKFVVSGFRGAVWCLGFSLDLICLASRLLLPGKGAQHPLMMERT